MSDVRVTVPNEYDFIVNTSTNTPVSVDGLDSMIQIVIKTLLTTPGRDVFEPEYGGGLHTILGATADVGNINVVQADVGLAVIKTSQDIIAQQNKNIDNLPPTARLRELYLQAFSYDPEQSLWIVDIKIETEAGNSTTTRLEI